MTPETVTTILWVYIVLLLVGGLMGLLKAKSKISLFTSAGFAALLALCATGVLKNPYSPVAIVVVLLIFFGSRFAKTKKFMPGGLMTVLSAAMLAVLLAALRN